MGKKNRIYYFSHLIVIISGIFYIIDLFMGGKPAQMLALYPGKFFNNYECWRLITYPLATSTAEGIILFLFTFLIFASKLEEIYKTILYPIVIMSVILFQGLVFTLVLWNSKIALAGTEGITFFVLTLFTLLNIKRKLVVVNKLYINAPLFTIAMVFIWLMTLYIHSLMSEDYKIIFTGLFSSIFGASIGLIAYLHIRFTNVINPKILSEALQEKRIKAIRQQLFSLAVIANEELKRVNRELIHNDEAVQDRHDYSEEKLNEILDKINDTGEKSLTDSEKEFLDGYANRI